MEFTEMGAGLEIYTTDSTLQVGKERYAAFLSESRTATQVGSGTVGEWDGVFRFLQTSGARLEGHYTGLSPTSFFPKLTSPANDTKWFRLLWRGMTGDIKPVSSGLEIYDSYGNIEYNSGHNPIKILEVISGRYEHPTGGAGTSSKLYPILRRNYGKPIMILIDRIYNVKGKLRIVANSAGVFEVDLDYNNNSTRGVRSFNYQFIVVDATGAV